MRRSRYPSIDDLCPHVFADLCRLALRGSKYRAIADILGRILGRRERSVKASAQCDFRHARP
jgi:hypothetical protein